MSAAPSPFRCTDAARGRGDPFVGTAPPARRWLLLEHPGPWRVDAVSGSGIDPAVLGPLVAAAAAADCRILLVRRPGRVPPGAARQWLLAGLDGPTVRGTWAGDGDLGAAATALTAPGGPKSAAPAAPDEPIILVCAHGVHDVCCAVRGRPVAAALAERWPEKVWESSHVGGDRFAPNVVLLPDGYFYGNLDPGSALTTVQQHLAGTVSTAHLRGMAGHPPAAQAAAAAAYERFGPLGPRDIEVRSLVHSPRYAGQASHTTVELDVPGVEAVVRVVVLGVRRAEAQLTCRAPRDTPATDYLIDHLDLVG